MILNKITDKWLDAYINRPKAALLIETNGDDLTAKEIIEFVHTKLATGVNSPLIFLEFENNSSIGIDDVREIQKSLTLKANNDSEVSRIIAISRASRLTNEAQNSILKLIEELPNNTIIAIIADRKENLLETVQSRCFVVPVLPISAEQASKIGKIYNASDSEVNKAYLLSEGNLSKFKLLLSKSDDKFVNDIERAKEFIRKSVFDRQKTLEKMKDKNEAEMFLRALSVTAKSGMRLSKTTESKNQWKQILKSVITAQEQVNANVNTKLAMLRLSVSLP